jgi:hypothetical protein
VSKQSQSMWLPLPDARHAEEQKQQSPPHRCVPSSSSRGICIKFVMLPGTSDGYCVPAGRLLCQPSCPQHVLQQHHSTTPGVQLGPATAAAAATADGYRGLPMRGCPRVPDGCVWEAVQGEARYVWCAADIRASCHLGHWPSHMLVLCWHVGYGDLASHVLIL